MSDEFESGDPQTLDLYCRDCDEMSTTHQRTETDEWACETCGNVKQCGNPQWSDNCDGTLTTPTQVQKGLCGGCRDVIRSWSDDEDQDRKKSEQATLVTDGGRDTENRRPMTTEFGVRVTIDPNSPTAKGQRGFSFARIWLAEPSTEREAIEMAKERDDVKEVHDVRTREVPAPEGWFA